MPVKLIQTEWMNEDIKPGNERFDKLLKSVREGGIREPITINLKWRVINGNHRLAVAKFLDMKDIKAQVWTGTELIK